MVHVCVGTAACPGTADFRPAVRAAGENLQIRTLLKKTSFIGYISGLFDDLVESTLLAGEKSIKDGSLQCRGFSSRTGRSRICSCVHHGPPGSWSDRASAIILPDPIKKIEICFCVLLRVNGLVLPVVMTQCALRSKNTAYLPRADRGRVNYIHEFFCPGSPIPEPGAGSRRSKFSI